MARDNGFNLLGSRGGGKVENRGNSVALGHNGAKKNLKSKLMFFYIKVFAIDLVNTYVLCILMIRSYKKLHLKDFTYFFSLMKQIISLILGVKNGNRNLEFLNYLTTKFSKKSGTHQFANRNSKT